jgi:hypothetical protein
MQVRDTFLEWLDEQHPLLLPPDTPHTRQMLASVWHCTDILPRAYCVILDAPQGSSYAQAAGGLARRFRTIAAARR